MNDSSARGRLRIARSLLRRVCGRLGGGQQSARRWAGESFGEPLIPCLLGVRCTPSPRDRLGRRRTRGLGLVSASRFLPPGAVPASGRATTPRSDCAGWVLTLSSTSRRYGGLLWSPEIWIEPFLRRWAKNPIMSSIPSFPLSPQLALAFMPNKGHGSSGVPGG